MAGTPFPFGTRIEIGKHMVQKGSGIGNSPEFSGIPLGIPNQDYQYRKSILQIITLIFELIQIISPISDVSKLPHHQNNMSRLQCHHKYQTLFVNIIT